MSGRARSLCGGRAVSLPRVPALLLTGVLAVLAGATCGAADDTSTPGAAGPSPPGAVIPDAPLGIPSAGAPLRPASGSPFPAGATPVATPAAAAPPSGLSSTGVSTAGPAVPPTGAADPAQAAEDIRDIRGPKYGLPLWVIVAAVIGAALLALAAYGIWRWRRRRLQARVLLPFEQALQQLDGIRPLMQPASAREFSIAVSDIVRGYIEQRFEVIATHRTTEEFMHDLLKTAKPSLARHRSLLADFLQQCDLVKFGGMSLSLRSIEALHGSARGFVLETAKPDPVTPANPKEAHDTVPAA